IEAGEETILQNSEEIWIKHSLDQVGNAAEKHSADDTDKHNEMQATGCSREQPVIERAGENHHDSGFSEKSNVWSKPVDLNGAEEEDHQRLDQDIKRVEPHDRWGQDAVVCYGLKQHC